jgi:hypothetical protein
VNHKHLRRTYFTLILFVLIAALTTTVQGAAPDRIFKFTGPCAGLNAEVWRSDECDAFIEANPVPVFEPAIEYVEQRDGQAISRAIYLPEQALPFPIAWMKRNWYYSDGPGVVYETNAEYSQRFVDRYNIFYIYNVVEVDSAQWYLVAPGKWIKDEYLSIFHVPERPEGVTGRWMVIDLQQQVLMAMEDDRPVLATLISSGYWLDTTEGLFQIYARTASMIMSGPPGADPPKYVFRTKWVMFFNEHQAVHSANFHNWFGLKRSHGCVNVVPGDEEWLWNWFGESADEWDPDMNTFYVDFPDKAPHVMVYNSPLEPEIYSW